MRWLIERKFLLPVILGVAFLLRAGGAVALEYLLVHRWHRPFLIEGDANGYWDLGRGLATTGELSVHEPPRRVMRMPGFPAIFAATMLVAGENRLAVRMVLAAVGTLACGLTYWLGKELFDSDTGMCAALLTALSPTMALFSILVLSDTPFAAAMLANLIVLAKLVHTDCRPESRVRGIVLAALAGATVTLAVYIRPSWLLAGPIFVVFYGLLSKNRLETSLRGVVLLASMFAALLPWALRNERVTGHVVWTTLWVGPSLYDGLNPDATGDSDMHFFERDHLLNRMSEYDMDQAYRNSAWDFAMRNPQQTAWLAWAKLKRYWSPFPNAPQFGAWWQKLIVAAYTVPLLLWAAWGWWISRRKLAAWFFTAGPVFYFSLIHMIFVSSLRYRLPAEYPLYVLSAVGVLYLSKRFRSSAVAA